MTLEEIREKLALKLNEEFNFWNEALTNTNPGNYGANDFDVEATYDNIYVDVPNRTFTFKDVNFSFNLRMDASNEGGRDESFLKAVAGSGEFQFLSATEITILNLKLDTYLDLYDR